MLLPININDLLGARTVESNRIEFKEGWNPDAIYRSICAFANDFDNSGGGYIVVGVAEEQGRAQRPVKGVDTEQLARIQREMIGFNNLIRPVYHPRLFIDEADGQQILVIWVPGSASRPHEVPEQITAAHKIYHYYIRQYANSVKVDRGGLKQELIAMTNQVPFDDRANTQASLNDLSGLWIREYLRVSRARLLEQAETLSKADLLDQMELLAGPPEYRFPRNAALMLFCEYPEKFFPYTYIELIDFREASGDKALTEYTFRGPVQYQIRQFMDKLRTLVLAELVIKVTYQSESLRPWSYPVRAVEEAIANCIFHRDYTVREPVKVFLHPDHMRFQNSGGPDRFIKPEDFQTGRVKPKRYRNRRLGDFLKELDLTEGHATGIRLILDEMAANGSPKPTFETDEERSFFEVELPIHPEFLKLESKSEPAKPSGIPGLTIMGSLTGELISMDVIMNAFDQVFADMHKHQREEDRRLISNLPSLSIQLLLNLSERRSMKRKDLLESIAITNQTKNAERFLEPLIQLETVETTIKDRPQSPQQQYRLTELGKHLIARLTDLSPSN